ncbi:hypothetical protein MLD38_016483 [Melastoma candidum]|uniref:Uncharacterized protein n=1 Tax=Melastoma candidum TaxID=119954 RepID=A0ACB9QML6_9MYRT|nr:hypothetical protein MLD38_016483 [Melastoma candidum]
MGEGGNDDGVPGKMSKRTVFVTVGTTSFDKLVMAADTDQLNRELQNKGYTHLVIQMGRGSYFPQKNDGADGSLAVDYFTFSPSIADHLKASSLMISHADGHNKFFSDLGAFLRHYVSASL